MQKFIDIAQKKVDELYLKKLLDYARGKPEPSESEALDDYERLWGHWDKLVGKISEGKLPKAEFVKEKNKWIETIKKGETTFRQGGELY